MTDEAMSAPKGSDARALTLALLAARAAEATVCPSEIAKALVAASHRTNWRADLPTVHDAVDQMLRDGLVCLSWKGKALPTRTGPYRIGHAD